MENSYKSAVFYTPLKNGKKYIKTINIKTKPHPKITNDVKRLICFAEVFINKTNKWK